MNAAAKIAAGKALDAAIVQYDLASRCGRGDEDYWLGVIRKIRDALAKADKPAAKGD